MNETLQEVLKLSFPKIIPRDLDIACGDGWYDLLEALCENIQAHVNMDNSRRKSQLSRRPVQLVPSSNPMLEVKAEQVKTKFGVLRFYHSSDDPFVGGLVSMAEAMSTRICELCGKKGSALAHGGRVVYSVRCEKCRQKK